MRAASLRGTLEEWLFYQNCFLAGVGVFLAPLFAFRLAHTQSTSHSRADRCCPYKSTYGPPSRCRDHIVFLFSFPLQRVAAAEASARELGVFGSRHFGTRAPSSHLILALLGHGEAAILPRCFFCIQFSLVTTI